MNGHVIRILVPLLLLAGNETAISAVPVDNDGLGWRMTHLDLDVTVLPDEARIVVEGVMQVELEQDRSHGPTILINSRAANMTFTRVDVVGADSIELNQPLPNRASLRLANIRFDEPLNRGAKLEIAFAYESEGGSGQFGVTERAAIGSWVDSWHPLPIFDPNLGSLSSQSKSVGTITLRMPADWRGAAEGNMVSRERTNTEVVERWTCDQPVARSFAAGNFSMAEQTIGDRTIRVYRLSDKGVSPERLARTIAGVLESLEGRYGPYPYNSYAIVETPGGLGSFGAASVQGMIYARPRWFEFADGSVPLFSHEMAHGWWGNLVGTKGPGSILCSESLAQYSAALAIESLFGFEEATEFMRFSRDDYIASQCAKGFFDLWRDGDDVALSRLGSGGTHHTLSDAKGHWVYHMLRRRVGDDVFFETLRTLLADYADDQISLNDLRTAFIQAAPDDELDQFFRQWLDQTGAPVLSVDWEPLGDDKIAVSIEQQQPGQPYHLMLELGMQHGEQVTRQTVELRERKQTFELPVAQVPTAVLTDPDHRLLIWTPDYGPNPLTYETEITLTGEQLQPYVGDYEVEGIGTVRFFVVGDELRTRVPPGSTWLPAQPIGEHQFRTDGISITFRLEDGKAVDFVFEAGGHEKVGKRIEDE